MRPTVRLAVSLLIGVSLGVGSARYMASTANPFVREAHGKWFAWPTAGHPDSSPYSLARFLLAERLPEHFSEVLTVFRNHDDDGGKLSSNCTYRLSMQRPQARRWVLSAFDGDTAQLAVLSDNDVVSSQDRIEVMAARDPQPGNWLRLEPDTAPTLVLRLYDTDSILAQQDQTISLPAVKLETCE
jgi:hypothetical protein